MPERVYRMAVHVVDLLEGLQSGKAHRCAAWPNSDVPKAGAVGVYGIWDDDRLIYAGMAGRNGPGGLLSDRLSYRYVLPRTAAQARELEKRVRRGELAAGRPVLNALP
jgi:hypothetical protein